MSRGLCRSKQDIFFSDDRADIERAKAICLTCPVRQPCEQYARSHDEYGVWGGTTEAERRRWTTRNDCPACGGVLVAISSSQEQCLSCQQQWCA
jgi:Transcription factor WhiB